MAAVSVEAKMAAAMKRLKALQGAIEDPAPILDEISAGLRASARSRFFTKTSPTGRPWKATKRSRSGKGRKSILVDRGSLRDSIEASMQGDKLYVGTDVFYGRIHQEGGKINATYRRKATSRKLRFSVRSITTAAGRSQKIKSIIKGFLRGGSRSKARNVRLPPRRFLGASKRDRKRTAKILIDKLSEALK